VTRRHVVGKLLSHRIWVARDRAKRAVLGSVWTITERHV
jgi:hypothetical protein